MKTFAIVILSLPDNFVNMKSYIQISDEYVCFFPDKVLTYEKQDNILKLEKRFTDSALCS
ncbi:hypothetical protein MASR2M70_04100 [Bacillota bacterium]